jgi:hypothetical protein
MDFHLFLSSLDSEALHPGNTPSDFTVELPQSIQLAGVWECALLDFQLSGATSPSDPFCLCSDICEESYVGDNQLPIFRRISLKGKKKDLFMQFNPLQYVTVKRDQFKRIRVFITSPRHTTVTVPSGELTCTLHLRSKRTP